MTKEELIEIEEIVRKKIKALDDSVPFLEENSKAVEPSVNLGRLTRMEAISDKGVQEHMLLQNRKQYEKLNNALDRIKKGTYGQCVRCQKDIPLSRLHLVPEALICVPCAEKKSKR